MNKLSRKALLMVFNAIILCITVIGDISVASVVTYDVMGVIYEPATQPNNTNFIGSFDWDGTTVSNLHGTLNSSMWETDDINPDYINSFPLLHLNYQLAQNVEDNIVTASVFLENTTDVFLGGGYHTGDAFRYGTQIFGSTSEVINSNAYFTIAFDKNTMEGVVEKIVYGDCTAGGMMGDVCMTGHSPAINSVGRLASSGTMQGRPLSITLTAVPLPAAVWLFTSAIVGLFTASRRKALLPS